MVSRTYASKDFQTEIPLIGIKKTCGNWDPIMVLIFAVVVLRLTIARPGLCKALLIGRPPQPITRSAARDRSSMTTNDVGKFSRRAERDLADEFESHHTIFTHNQADLAGNLSVIKSDARRGKSGRGD